jgi:CubicO group peptidase (beta-lactamase class C family)
MKKQLLFVTAILFALTACKQQANNKENINDQDVSTPSITEPYTGELMIGFPPSKESQVTFGNYREYPYSKWAFQNAGAPLNVLMIPRSGNIVSLNETFDNSIGDIKLKDANNEDKTVNNILEENFTDGFLVLKGDDIIFERYFNGLTKDYQHIWFSATKSLTSTAFGILVDQGKVNLSDSPSIYIPELKGSGFERVTIQNLLDHSTSIDFEENYTDPNSEFIKYYGPAMNMAKIPGGRDAEPQNTEIYGTYDFLEKFIRPNNEEIPGDVFDYNSANSDLLGWLIARISGISFDQFIQKYIWSKLGAEHDAYIAVDRAYMGVSTAGFNSTLRDAARFGNMILNRGRYNGQQIVSADWVDATINLTSKDKEKMKTNEKYEDNGWVAYKNNWWVIDDQKGEYAAVGIHGQVIYINREANIVIAYFSSQPGASSAGYAPFRSKLLACQEISKQLN